MPWNSIADLAPGDIITEAWVDGVRENLDYLLSQRVVSLADDPGVWYLTSGGTWGPVDDTRFNIPLTTEGGLVLAGCEGYGRTEDAGAYYHLDLEVDGARIGTSAKGIIGQKFTAIDQAFPIGFTVPLLLPAGTHTLRLMHMALNGTCFFITTSGYQLRFWAAEV